MNSPRRYRLRLAWQAVKTVLFVAAVVLWAIFLRPQFLGGPAQFILVSGTSMEPQMHTGDLVLVTRSSAYRVGERVAYRIPEGEPAAGRVVIHRIVGGSAAAGFEMRGDNRATNDRWKPKAAEIVGTTLLRIPAGGRAARAVLTPIGLGVLAGLAVFAFIALGPDGREPRVRRSRDVAPGAAPAEPVVLAAPEVAVPAPPVVDPAPPSSAGSAKPRVTVRVCLERTAANVREGGAAARARRLERPDEPQPAAATMIELAAGVQHAAARWRGRLGAGRS